MSVKKRKLQKTPDMDDIADIFGIPILSIAKAAENFQLTQFSVPKTSIPQNCHSVESIVSNSKGLFWGKDARAIRHSSSQTNLKEQHSCSDPNDLQKLSLSEITPTLFVDSQLGHINLEQITNVFLGRSASIGAQTTEIPPAIDTDKGFVTHLLDRAIAAGIEDKNFGVQISIDNFDIEDEELSAKLTAIDENWKGEGSSYCMSQSYLVKRENTSKVSFPAIVNTYHHALLLQTEGRQTIRFISVQDQEGSPENNLSKAYPCYSVREEDRSAAKHILHVQERRQPFPVYALDLEEFFDYCQERYQEPLRICEIELKEGDAVFIPMGACVEVKISSVDQFAASKSTVVSQYASNLEIGLPPQVSWIQIFNECIARAQEALDISPDKRKFAHTLDRNSKVSAFGTAVKQQITSLLFTANEYLDESINDYILARCSFTRSEFNLSGFVQSKYGLLDELLEKSLLEGDSPGLIKISNFLPDPVADRIWMALNAVQDEEWVVTQADDDAAKNNIAHNFFSSTEFPAAPAIFNIFKSFCPHMECGLSAGKYLTGDFISPHDDRQYKMIGNVLFSRQIAMIYYLTPDWTESDGGQLFDMETDRKYIPEFNSVIAFKVPRWHVVEPVLSEKHRLSIFGWFVTKGKSYDLNLSSY